MDEFFLHLGSFVRFGLHGLVRAFQLCPFHADYAPGVVTLKILRPRVRRVIHHLPDFRKYILPSGMVRAICPMSPPLPFAQS
jgi:hypothetical protein